MRCMRQSGQGASLSTYSNNHPPASVARLTTKAAPAAVAAGSAASRSVQFVFIVAHSGALAGKRSGGTLPVLCVEARASRGNGDSAVPIDAVRTRLYRGCLSASFLAYVLAHDPTAKSGFPGSHRGRAFPDQALGPCGGTGRRARLKIVFRKEWGFDSLHGHHHRDSYLIRLSFFSKKSHLVLRWDTILFCFVLVAPDGA